MIRTDLLETLKEFLKTIATEKFDLDSWRYTDNTEIFISDDYLKNECGTTACAMGWAATLPEFKEAGLIYSGNTICHVNPLNKKDVEFSFEAVKRVFGFHHSNTSQYLFLKLNYEKYGHIYVGPERVIARIERLLQLLEIPEGVTLSESDLNNSELKAEVQFIMESYNELKAGGQHA